mmetsp:Transcript_10126/g.15541  ORF Transcript_10126/g.15541 Transcript_10126/m.15541 type:complete len:514 (-) Transcript_10126:353-1894(-)
MQSTLLLIQIILYSALTLPNGSAKDSLSGQHIRGKEEKAEGRRNNRRRKRHLGGKKSKKLGRGNADITSNFLVTFLSRVEDLTERDFRMLENRFADAYNYLTSERSIIHVDINHQSQSSMANKSMTTAKTFIYEVDADCNRQCVRDGLTHSDEINNFRGLRGKKDDYKRLKKKDSGSKSYESGTRKGKRAKKPNKFSRGKKASGGNLPTEDELRREYSEEIRYLNLHSLLLSVSGVSEVAELEKLPSPGMKAFWTTLVEIDVTGDTSFLPSNLQTLEAAFLESYKQLNSLNSQTCDPLFRVANSTEAEIGSSTTTADVQNYKISFSVDFTCRGCPQIQPLFAPDVTSRIFVPVATNFNKNDYHNDYNTTSYDIKKVGCDGENGRYGDCGDSCSECFCPVKAYYNRAPTASEFLPVFDNNVRILKQQGEVLYINSVNDVNEIPVDVPMLRPTPRPTPQPTSQRNGISVSNRVPKSNSQQALESVLPTLPLESVSPSYKMDGFDELIESATPSSP